MKNQIVLSCLLMIGILSLSNFTEGPKFNFIFTALEDAPNLPNQPFDYAGVTFPKHLKSTVFEDTLDTGYESFGIDTHAFKVVTDHGATLGRVLFYDEKLSALENISCASCHQQHLSFSDDAQFSEGISAPTKRNSMPLNDLAWTNKQHFFWDMSHESLHETIILPLTDDNEIGADLDDISIKLGQTSYYPQLFANAFGDPEINEERIVEALVQFISSINSFNSKFDIGADSDFQNFTPQELEGQQIFSESCGQCHSQGAHNPFGNDVEIFFPPDVSALFFFPDIFNNGLAEDPNDMGAGEWDPFFTNLFKIPTLKNIELTAPYMHDGRFETLDEVIDHYSDDIIENEWSSIIPTEGFKFSATEKASLKAFLLTLTDNTMANAPKWSNPFETVNVTEPVDDSFDVTIYPNPFMEQATISVAAPDLENTVVSIFDSNGKLIKQQQVSETEITLDKSEFSAGLYVIELRCGDKLAKRKMIVQ